MNNDLAKIANSFTKLYNTLVEMAETFFSRMEELLFQVEEVHERIENKQTFNFTDIKKFKFQSQVMLNKPKFIRARSCLQ